MQKRTFYVRACWDADANIYYSESDIEGLHIEAKDLDEFEAVMMEVAPELVIANHVEVLQLKNTPLKDLVPAILWQRPQEKLACA